MIFNLASVEDKNKILAHSMEVELECFKCASQDTVLRPPCSFPSPVVSSSSPRLIFC